MRQILLFFFNFLMLGLCTLSAQSVELTVRYNGTSARYEVFARAATATTFNLGLSQISIVVPSSVADAPLVVTPSVGSWADNSQVFAPIIAPSVDFHGIGTGALNGFSLAAAQELLLFSFTLPGGGCVDGIRLFNNTDPASTAPGMSGLDFRNNLADVATFPAGNRFSVNYNNIGTNCSANCGCVDVTVSLDADCKVRLTPGMISPNCTSGTVRVMDGNQTNADVIDCAGVWTYGLFDGNGNVICWGKVTAEDKTGPVAVCTPADVTLDCYDVNYVLNNHLTIGDLGTTSSPRPAANSRQTILNAEGNSTLPAGPCSLPSTMLVSDNINNLGYAYFKDNCFTCGCRINLKWSDKVVFYSCTDMLTNGGVYAKIEREWVASDCNGMSSSFVQDIFFKRPDTDDFSFANTSRAGVTTQSGVAAGIPNYDWVVSYSSCITDKSLIAKADVTPRHCSFFNSAANPRCLFIDQVECNYSVQIKDLEFPICGGKGVKIDRELYVFDWCEGGIVDTFHILIKIGDFEAPTLEYARNAPFEISTGPMDCTSAIPVSVAGIKSAFGVTIKDNCSLGNVSATVKTKDRYVKGILVAENVWEQVDYPVMNGMMIGLPVGSHRLILDVFDGCYNSRRDSFNFEVKDKIAPVMKCDDDLHITLSNANGYTNGYAQVSADDIDEGSWDNCKMSWIAVRRNVPTSCAASFIAKGYDTNNNGTLDTLPADGDWTKADGFDANGDGDLADFGETFILKGGKLMTPLQDIVEFFCCDLAERVTIELWGEDIYGNRNYCWNDVLIEDKVAPTCLAPWALTVYCDDKSLGSIDSKVASAAAFGDVTIPSGNDCAALDTTYSTDKKLKCGYGYIDRSWTVTKQTVKGPISVTCTQRITILPVREYDIRFPKDASADCKTPIVDTVLTDELGCDILSVNVTDKRYDASDDECYKIFRTYTVIDWCAYDDRCGDPMATGNVFVVSRAIFQSFGSVPIWLLVRDNDRDGDEEFFVSRNTVINEALSSDAKSGDYHVLGDPDRNGTTAGSGYNSTNFSVFAAQNPGVQATMPFCNASAEYYHSFMYTQIIKVYDETRPVVTADPAKFCIREGGDCLADLKMVITGKDECSDKVTLETQFLMIAPGQTLNASSMIMFSTPRWSTKDLGNGQFEINVANLPQGKHDLIVVVRDECGNLSTPTRIPFTVEDCKGPAPICINGLSTELMSDGAGGGMMAVWASDFVASKIYDCNGQGPETQNGLKLVTKYSLNRVGSPVISTQTGLNLTCADAGKVVLVELHAWDEAGKDDFCITYIEVQDNRKVCTPVSGAAQIAGTIATEGNANLQGATITLSGAASQAENTTANGGYSFLNLTKGADFTVTPQLDKNHLNGVSTFDLVLVQKHILNVAPLNSPYKLIAADVNNSKSITTLDLIALRKLILNIDQTFTNNSSWRFVDAAFRFPTPSNPWATQFPEVVNVNDLAGNVNANFVAIKIGDVNASASTSSAAAKTELRTDKAMIMSTTEQQLVAGQSYDVTFKVKDLAQLQGYQFTLVVDPSHASIETLDYSGVMKAEHFGVFPENGVITASFNQSAQDALANLNPDANLFTLKLKAKSNTALSSALLLNSRWTNTEAYNLANETIDVKLSFGSDAIADHALLRQNVPNPFIDETSINFYLPKASKAVLTVRDTKGALIYQVEGNYAKGENQVILKEQSLRASGVLYYTLESEEFTQTRKMIVLQK